MAFPALLGLTPALAKLTAGLGIGAKTVGATAAATGAGATAATTGAKMAASAAFKQGLGKAIFGEMSKGQIAQRLAPDLLFGGFAAAQTPGDIGDKLIAGGTQAIGGGLGGIAAGRLASPLGEGVATMADFAGSFGGDFAGMAVGDTLQRGKDKVMGGKGQTAWERMTENQQQEFAEQIRNETLMGLGIGPGYMPGAQDQYLAQLGLG